MDTALILTVIALAVGVGGVAVAVYGLKARQRPLLRYVIDFDPLVDPSEGLAIDGLLVTVDGRSVTRLSRTYVAFWHQRGDEVYRQHIDELDPLRVQLEDDDFALHTSTVYLSKPENDL